MAGKRSVTARVDRGSQPRLPLGPTLVAGTGLLLGLLGAIIIVSGTATIERHAFDSMRQRGIGLTRILALAAAGAEERGGSERLQAVLEQVAGDGDLVYAGIVDRDGAVVLEAGAAGARPIYAARSLPVAPSDQGDRIVGLGGEPLFLFTFPIEIKGRSVPAPALAAGGSGAETRVVPRGVRENAMVALMADQCRHLLGTLDEPELRDIALQKMEGYTNEELAASHHCSLARIERKLRLIRDVWKHQS